MCGICGVIHFDQAPASEPLLRAMSATLRHRGPDGDGIFIDGSLGMAMRRLSIIDIPGSHQPLTNEDGSVALVFNGEIYNYRDLRAQLVRSGHQFRSDGDGETINHLYEDHGVDCLQRLRGMFAIALWDQRRQTLLLARDRLGQKPLYYYHDQTLFVFASEIKALLAHPAVPRVSRFDSDTPALAQYLSFGYIPAPATAFAGIKMLPPATWLRVNLSGESQSRRYWDLPTLAPPAKRARPSHYIEDLRHHLDEAVKLRLISDVPLGAFLSGGLDSSLIVALMRRHSNATVKTFSIGFEGDDSFDETAYAELVARRLGTQHTAFRVQPTAINLLSDLVRFHDQPFADSSAIPTFLVSQLTRQQVTVALTGDGGDELFAGYERFYAAQLMNRLPPLPAALWRAIARLPGREGAGYYNPVKRLRRFARAASQPLDDAYFDLVRVFSADLIAALCQTQPPGPVGLAAYLAAQQGHPVAALVEANMRSYLPDDLLIKTDRCSMAASLEARAPFLDHALVEFAASIPFNLKLKGAAGKFILKQAARDLLPPSIIHRPKHGFGIPLGAWLRRDMSPVRDLLLSQSSRQRGYFNIAEIQRLIAEHAAGRRDHSRQLWTLLTLEEWRRQYLD